MSESAKIESLRAFKVDVPGNTAFSIHSTIRIVEFKPDGDLLFEIERVDKKITEKFTLSLKELKLIINIAEENFLT